MCYQEEKINKSRIESLVNNVPPVIVSRVFSIGFWRDLDLGPLRMNSNQELEKPVSTGDWILSLIVLCIPIVGFIIMLVWAFGGTPSSSKRNFCRAQLFFLLLFIALSLLFLFAFGGMAMLSNLRAG